MSSVNILDNEQRLLIERISRPGTGVTRQQATVSVYLYFHRLAKPAGELKSIITAVDATLLTERVVEDCLKWMIAKGLAVETLDDKVNMRYIEITPAYETVMEELTKISGLANDLKSAYGRAAVKVWVSPKDIVGQSKDNYIEMLELIQHAHKRVNYAVLTTEPYDDTARVLKIAANNGVKVRILVASEKITQAIKQKSSVEKAWREEFRNCKNVEIRVFDDDFATELCSSVQVDDVLRFIIYDPHRIRSLYGYLIEMRNSWNENLNLIRWYSEKFDHTWENSYASDQDRVVKQLVTPLSGAFLAMVGGFAAYFVCRSNSDVTQGLVDELLLLVIGASGEYIIRTLWPKAKNLAVAVWKTMKKQS